MLLPVQVSCRLERIDADTHDCGQFLAKRNRTLDDRKRLAWCTGTEAFSVDERLATVSVWSGW